MRLNDKKNTIMYFDKALNFYPDDFELKINYCSYLETFDTFKAFLIYRKVIK